MLLQYQEEDAKGIFARRANPHDNIGTLKKYKR